MYQQLRLFLREEAEAIVLLRKARTAIAHQERKRQEAERKHQEQQLVHVRLLAFQIGRSALGFVAITGWLFLGSLIGAIAGHNLLSRAVLCDQVMCEVLRLDGNQIRK